MIDGPHLFGSLILASHRNGSPIKLPRAEDEVVMLAFDQRNSRLMELHIFTGKTAAPVPAPSQPPLRRWVKPVRWQSRRKWTPSRLGGRKSKPSARRRQLSNSRGHAKCLHRFYETKTTSEPAAASSEILAADFQLHTCELLRGAAGLRGPSFMTILEVGMDDGLAYYVTNLNDGEFVQEYVQRRGAVPTVTSLALMHQLLQDLGKAEGQAQLHSSMSLDRVMVTSQEEEYLQLRLFDYGLSQSISEGSSQNGPRLVEEACRLLFLLMTGQAYPGGNPDDFGVIAELPASLRFAIKSVLTSRPADVSISIKTLRDEVREAICSYVTLAQARNLKTLLVADLSTLPLSHLQTLLLGEVPLKTLFGTSFRIQNPEFAGCHAFTISAVNVSDEQPVTLHLLPPERIIPQTDLIALPPQVWRQDPAKQINLLHMMGLWKGPDWAFLTEVHEPGMSLSALMAKRGTLNPGEVVTLLRQIHAGLEQALETGVPRIDLEPANIELCVGYDGPVLPRDVDRLHLKRLDAWPKFVVKLRLHKTMRSLCKPRLIDLSPWEYNAVEDTAGTAAREERHRSFICLAVYLLTGEGQMREIADFPTSMPEMATIYLQESLQRVLNGSTVPYPAHFTEKLSYLLSAARAETDSIEDPLAAQELESAGSVSDFEEDWTPAAGAVDHAKKTLLLAPVSADLKSLDFHRPSPPRLRFQRLALAATALLLGALGWMIFGDLREAGAMAFTAVPKSPPQETVSLQEEIVEPRPSPAVIPHPQTLPQPIIHKIPAVVDVSVPVTPTPEAPAAPMLATVPEEEKQPFEKKIAASLPEPAPVAPETPAISQPPVEAEPVIRRAIVTSVIDDKPSPADLPASSSSPAVSSVVAATEPPMEVAKLQEVTVRHAIVISPEEISAALRPQPQARKKNSRRR